MGITKQYTRHVMDAGQMEAVQALTQASTATPVNNYGLTTITSAGSGTVGDHGFVLQAPRTGLVKKIVIDANSTRTVTVYTDSTATHFFGGTSTSITFSTGTGLKWIELCGTGSDGWAITSVSTGATLS